MLIGKPINVTMISDVLALGPLSQNFLILFAMNSETRTYDPSLLTATPPAPESPLSSTVTCCVMGLYDSNRPVASPESIACWTWLH